ncbi:MAG: hypothetical protein K0U54_05125, partial [Bacteroidetes bacterium]|nr:hypothetical protein [Bacteroidota bacterium]
MNALTYKRILYFISLVILATLCSQLYWNYKNYQISKQQLTNDVQTSLDNAVDAYFTNIAAGDTYEFLDIDSTFVFSKSPSNALFLKDTALFETQIKGNLDSLNGGITIIKSSFGDSIQMDLSIDRILDSMSASTSAYRQFPTELDFQSINELSSKIMISFSENSFSLPGIDSLFSEELDRKKISVDYGLTHNLSHGRNDTIRGAFVKNAALSTSAHSPLFFHKDELKAHFPNITMAVLKSNILGVLLSFLLLAAVVGCLLYLLKIIQQQKELAAVKNDLISNITHEFKTPLATIGIAME